MNHQTNLPGAMVIGPRERFQKWVLSTEHPVYGWLDGHWLRRGDERDDYANEYVQGLWVAFKAFSAPPVQPPAVGEPDKTLCNFYEVDSYPDLVRELVHHVSQLQDSARRNVKPWEDTFPPILLPAYIARVNAENAKAQPATAKVVLPERLDLPHRGEFESADQYAAAVGETKKWNACLDEVASLNGLPE